MRPPRSHSRSRSPRERRDRPRSRSPVRADRSPVRSLEGRPTSARQDDNTKSSRSSSRRRSRSRSDSRERSSRSSRHHSSRGHKSSSSRRDSRSKSRSRSRSRSPSRRSSGHRSSRHGSSSRHSSSRNHHHHKSSSSKRSRRSRSRSYSSTDDSSETDSSSDSESDRDRKRRKHSSSGKRKKDRKDRKKDKKKSKKEKKSHASKEYGTHGILTPADMWNKESEFQAWLMEVKKLNPETIQQNKMKEHFLGFMEDFNTVTMPHEKFYNLQKWEDRQQAIRMGERLPTERQGFVNLMNDEEQLRLQQRDRRKMNAHASGSQIMMTQSQLQELRKVQHERVEADKLRRLGLDAGRKGVRYE
ncbi:hypothetical protein BGZ83_001845 [Gryganskiella cystojenkinii]|nr:hypothetical protein BGZ83_001845 [Gryganskiella cystojenkinii]